MTWQNLRVASCGTHHVDEHGQPVYSERFDEVLKFHAPGLAPVQCAGDAWHVGSDGTPAYRRRFLRTFGFYEGLAAVVGPHGWHHIAADGEDAYNARHAWCGNFQQGRCAVRAHDHTYHHITADGSAAYTKRWRYAGDYRDGIAVVQAADGHSTHVGLNGAMLHGGWFVDLDVFHKGFARARDEDGWMHIDLNGRPVYRRRFQAVEPFYNGQARVERFDGALEVIDEGGATLVELRPARQDPLHQVSAELVSFWRCEAIFAAVDLGTFNELPIENPPPRLRRLLEALGELGLVKVNGCEWSATPTGDLLRSHHPRSLAAAAKYWASEGRRGWARLPEAVAAPDWSPRDPFADVAHDPSTVAAFHAALQTYAENDYADITTLFEETEGVLIDAGGATGALSKLLLRAKPGLRAVVLDRPDVVRIGCPPDELADRLTFVGGDLFLPWPCNGDAVVLARVLHDWSDERCVVLLRHAKAALPRNGRLYVVELVRRSNSFDGGLLSLHLMVTSGGMERTAEHYERLLTSGGFRLVEVRPSRGISSVIVAEAT